MSSIADESLFQRLLALERRRCERTDGRFALLLIDVEALNETVDTGVLEGLGVAVGSVLRETDITGWYERPGVIGVILTTLNGVTREALEPLLAKRIQGIWAGRLTPVQIQRIRISCHMFPDDGVSNRIFYSDDNQGQQRNKSAMFVKRMMDIAGSLAALALLSPLFLIIALAIRLTSPGPVFFRQRRIGQFGKEFVFLKFRSMVVNNDPAIHKEYIRNLIENKATESNGSFKIMNDPRVTPIGKILRKSSLDELPQFMNVLKGEMALVGPRPPIPYEFESYSLWHRRRIAEAKPGITGEWQVHGRSRTTFDEMVRMDLHYIRNQSVWLDLKILIKTPLAVLSGHGAY